MNAQDRQKTLVQEHFRDTSRTWRSRYAQQPEKMSDMDLLLRRENVHRLIRPLLGEGSGDVLRVLDLGCGTGDVLDGLSRESMHVTGTDVVREMVDAAAAAHPLDDFLVCDAQQVPVASASMDVVTCLGVIEYIADPRTVLAQISDVLRPGGYFIVSLPNRISLFRRLSAVEIAAEKRLSAILRRIRGTTAPARSNRITHRQWSPHEGQQLLEAAGLSVREMLFSTYGLWGKLGRWSISMELSKRMSREFSRSSVLARTCACTMVFLAQKRSSDGSEVSAAQV
jgi:2-polyprenyl-3-methyl-5-hydroxy-6-metoxy-1,4-benzoquinol methylase